MPVEGSLTVQLVAELFWMESQQLSTSAAPSVYLSQFVFEQSIDAMVAII